MDEKLRLRGNSIQSERIPRAQACQRDSPAGAAVTRGTESTTAVRREPVEAGTLRPVSVGTRPHTGATVSRDPASAAGVPVPETGRRSAR